MGSLVLIFTVCRPCRTLVWIWSSVSILFPLCVCVSLSRRRCKFIVDQFSFFFCRFVMCFTNFNIFNNSTTRYSCLVQIELCFDRNTSHHFSNELNGCSMFICDWCPKVHEKSQNVRYFISVFYLQNNCVNLINNRNLLLLAFRGAGHTWGYVVAAANDWNNGKMCLFIERPLKATTTTTSKTINYNIIHPHTDTRSRSHMLQACGHSSL